MDLVVKFTGQAADQHLLPAFEGSQSLEGISRTLVLVSHYIATGTVRKRYPFDSPIRVYIKATQPGSFDSVFSLLTDPNTALTTTALGAAGVAVGTTLVLDLTMFLVR